MAICSKTEEKLFEGSRKRGNWITFPFIISNLAGSSLAVTGCIGNLIVYLIHKFNIKNIDAAQISNVASGCGGLFALVGAILADSFLGSFSVVTIFSSVSLLGSLLLSLTAVLDSLRPSHCEIGSSLCIAPSSLQFAVLYSAIAMVAIGYGGQRYTLATMGANQFDKLEDQGSFFNWYFAAVGISTVIGGTAVFYIEDNISWSLGFRLCVAANFVGLVAFLLGNRFYRYDKPQGSPFTGLAHVVVASVKKRKMQLSSKDEDYYHHHELDQMTKESAAMPTKSLRFLSRAALKAEGDLKPDGSVARPWRLCSVQQVEDLKRVIRIFPLWSTAIFPSVTAAMQFSLAVLQALTINRHLGGHFVLPAGSISVVSFLSTSIFLTLINWCFDPMWRKLAGKAPPPIQRMAIGHVFFVLTVAVAALVEMKRLNTAKQNRDLPALPMSILWLVPQLALLGLGEAFIIPGQVAFYYQEFPIALHSTSTSLISLHLGIGFYISSALIDLIRKVTDWLPDNINRGRLDNVYWMLVILGVLNFVYYLVCAKLYKFQGSGV